MFDHIRKGVVAVETALVMIFIWLPALAVLWLVVAGGSTHLRLVDATATTGGLILAGHSEQEALEAGNLVAGGGVSIADGFIVAEKQIKVFGKAIPIRTTRPVIR